MIIKIDFNSDEAIYMQITNQIIMGIAKRQICDGDQLPSIRNMADEIGINMHTVNKAYTVLRQAGYVKLDRRRGAIVSVDVDKIEGNRRNSKRIVCYTGEGRLHAYIKREDPRAGGGDLQQTFVRCSKLNLFWTKTVIFVRRNNYAL